MNTNGMNKRNGKKLRYNNPNRNAHTVINEVHLIFNIQLTFICKDVLPTLQYIWFPDVTEKSYT